MIYVFAKKLARFATGVSFHPLKGFTYIFCRSVFPNSDFGKSRNYYQNRLRICMQKIREWDGKRLGRIFILCYKRERTSGKPFCLCHYILKIYNSYTFCHRLN